MAIQALKDRSGFQIRINYKQQRLVIYLGKATKKQAIQFERNLQRLFIGKAAGVTMEPDLALWLAGLSDPLHDKIAQKGFVAPRDPKVYEITWLDAVSRFNKEFSGKRSMALQPAQCQRDFNAFLRLQGRSIQVPCEPDSANRGASFYIPEWLGTHRCRSCRRGSCR